MAYSMLAAYAACQLSERAEFSSPMRNLFLLAAAIGLAAPAASVAMQPHGLQREQDNAYRATQQGQVLPLPQIRARIRIRGAHSSAPSSTAASTGSNICAAPT